jgi:hypothetical protein
MRSKEYTQILYSRIQLRVKGQCHEIFNLCFFFRQTILFWSLIHALTYFRISLRIRREINENVLPRAMRHSAGPWSQRYVA